MGLDSGCKVILTITVLPHCDKTRAGTLKAHFTSNLHVKCDWYVLGTALLYIQEIQKSYARQPDLHSLISLAQQTPSSNGDFFPTLIVSEVLQKIILQVALIKNDIALSFFC